MDFQALRGWWSRFRHFWGWRPKGQPCWGPGPPTIIGVCARCGAAVLQGWHHEIPGGLLCRRCDGKE